MKTLSGIEGEPIYFSNQDSQECFCENKDVFEVFVEHTFSEHETHDMTMHDSQQLTAHLQD